MSQDKLFDTQVLVAEIKPKPTDEEAAAIVAAIEAAWPKRAQPEKQATPKWRFASRWFNPISSPSGRG